MPACWRGLADAVQTADEIVRRRVRLAALVMEADQVAQGVIAEHDAQFGIALPHFVRPVKQSLDCAHVRGCRG